MLPFVLFTEYTYQKLTKQFLIEFRELKLVFVNLNTNVYIFNNFL